MENLPEPSAPPSELPKPVKTEHEIRPKFSYLELQFNDSFTIDGRKFVSFFVGGNSPFYVHFLRIEFEEYQRAYFERFDTQVENEQCSCDECLCDFELVDEELVLIKIKNEDGSEYEIEESFPIYALFNPVMGLKVGICDVNKHKKDA